MSPEKARVFVVEDNERFQKIIIKRLKKAGHSVVATATTLDQALAMVDQLEQLGVGVAVLDGNLSDYDVSGNDGREILKAIQKKDPNVITVGMSLDDFEGTDVDLGKDNVGNLGEVVKSL
jgi:CheY-like chemotaxis protein